MAQVRTEVLQLRFENQAGKKVTFRIPDPKEDLTSEQVLDVMEKVLEYDVFTSNGGLLTSPESARVVETITEEYDIDVN
jgi:hypothetical protein